MAMNATDLADEIKSGLGFGSEPQSTELTNISQDIVDHILTGVVSHAVGTVTGIAPSSGGPLQNGAATSGTISLVASDLETRFVTSFGQSTPEISGMANAISTHIATGLVSFAVGNITGTCGNTASSPGPLVGEGSGGVITGLSASTLATAISNGLGQGGTTTTELDGFAGAIVDHILNNAEVSYATGSVTGTCPAGGGPIIGGTATGGTIS